MNESFFERYRLEIEQGKLVNIQTMKQGDKIYCDDSCHMERAGTLGGFVVEKTGLEKKYALTSSHLFPSENLPAYTERYPGIRLKIGKCVFTTRDNCMDFAAIEMNEHIDCDVFFRGVDGKKTNARVYKENMGSLCFVHKIGAGSGLTTGFIVSSEYYDKLFGSENHIFLVSGADGCPFSSVGDSGSLVFSRSRGLRENYVNVVGLVSGIYHDYCEKGENEGASFGVSSSSGNISCCFRISPALDLFQRTLDIAVKFKEDLSFTSSSENSS